MPISLFLAFGLEAHGDAGAETGTNSGGRSLGDFHVMQEGQRHRTAQGNLLQLGRDLLQRCSHATRRKNGSGLPMGLKAPNFLRSKRVDGDDDGLSAKRRMATGLMRRSYRQTL